MPIQQNCANDLQRKDQGQAQNEFEMLCLMPEQVHSCDGARAAAQERGGEKRSLRDSPQISFCPELVCKHKQESSRID